VNETRVHRDVTMVLRVRADFAGKGPSEAFDRLESRLPSLKGRRFYGTFSITPTGEEYHACVERINTDDPASMQLEVGEIPGGWYIRRKLIDWEAHLSELPTLFAEMAQTGDVDPSRPSVEYYRSRTELHLLVPVKGP
jgi:hypothetical protein